MTPDDNPTSNPAAVVSDKLEGDLKAVRGIAAEARKHRDELQRGPGAREASVAVTELESAENWLVRAIAVARGLDI
jgi:hypothetical protein